MLMGGGVWLFLFLLVVWGLLWGFIVIWFYIVFIWLLEFLWGDEECGVVSGISIV